VLVSDKIIAALKDSDKPLNTVQICERTGVSIPQTYLPLFRLRQAGTITRERNEVGHLVYAIDNTVINSIPAPKEDKPTVVAPKPKKKLGRPKGSTKKPQPTPAPTTVTLSEVSKFVRGSWVSTAEHEAVKNQRDAYEKQWLDALAVIDYLERKKV
jgi:hypothetical protein